MSRTVVLKEGQEARSARAPRPIMPVVVLGAAGILLSVALFAWLDARERGALRDDLAARTMGLMSSLRSSAASQAIGMGVQCMDRMAPALAVVGASAEWSALATDCIVVSDFYSSSLFWASGADSAGRRTIVEQVAPEGPSSRLVGTNLADERSLAAALAAARHTGRSVLLARVPLESELEVPTEWFNLRVIRGGDESHRAGFAGIHVLTRVERMSQSLVGGIEVFLVDGADPATARRGVDAIRSALGTSPRFETGLRSGGIDWQVVTWPLPSLIAHQRTGTPWKGLVAGLLATLMACELLRRAITRRRRIGELVERRTLELMLAKRALEEKILESELRLASYQESEERFRALFERAPDAYFLGDRHGALLDVNRAGEALVQRSRQELVGRTLFELELIDPEEIERTARLLHAGDSDGLADAVELSFRREDGTEVFVEVRLQNVRLRDQLVTLGLCRDLSDRRRLELEQAEMREQLLNAQKLDAIGQLAGGIAHDFNNMLTCIQGHAELLLRGDLDPEALGSARAIEGATRRAADLTQQLLGFARRGKQRNVEVDLHSLIQDAASLLSRTIPKTIDITQVLSARQPLTLGDPSQLQQVILNLALNARDAMPDGGKLTIGTATTRETGRGKPAEEVVITVSDTGTGMSPEIRERMFEPFFTTKPVGRGTGMGLAMVYGIVQNHGGRVEVETTVSEGTTFRVVLPGLPGSERAALAPRAAAENSPTPQGLQVMVIDDDAAILAVLGSMLDRLGCRSVRFANGREAIDWYAEHWSEVDAVIVDLTMPPPDGRECFRALRELHPGVRAVVATGHGKEGMLQEMLDAGVLGYLHKPFTLGTLGRVLEEVAGEGGLGSGPFGASVWAGARADGPPN